MPELVPATPKLMPRPLTRPAAVPGVAPSLLRTRPISRVDSAQDTGEGSDRTKAGAVLIRPRAMTSALPRRSPCRIKITKQRVDALIHLSTDKQTYRYDDELRGFGVSVYKGSASFFVEKSVNGKCIRRTFGRFGVMTVDAARNKARYLLSLLHQGIDPKVDEAKKTQDAIRRSITLAEVSEQFFSNRSLKRSTALDYRGILRRYFGDWMLKPIGEISSEMVVCRFSKLAQGTKANHATGAKEIAGHPATANGAFRVLRSICSFAEGQDLLPKNPVDVLSRSRMWRKELRRRERIWDEQFPRFFKALGELRIETPTASTLVGTDYIEFVLFTGLRREEAAGLTWDRVDMDKRTVRFENTKNGQDHALPLTDHLFEIVRRRREACPSGCPWVFPSPAKASRGHLAEPRYIADEIMAKSGLKFRIHDLRRTFISVAEELGIPSYTLKRLLNHASNGDVTAGYIVSSVDKLRPHMERITDHLLALSRKTPMAQHAQREQEGSNGLKLAI
jgi:integrase